MSSTTMHFGPEWMRKPQSSTRAQPPPDTSSSAAPAGASTYSALVSPAPPAQPEKRDEAHPFRYSREELLRIYREGGGKGGLGLEVERWEGVVREAGSEPIALREMNDYEKKLFQGPLNSDLRRRQSTADYLSPLSTQSLGTAGSRLNLTSPASATGSPLRDRFGALRRRDSTEQPTITIPRKQSFSSLQPAQASPRDANISSPRRGPGYTPNFDGVLGGAESWVARRRASEASLKAGAGVTREPSGDHQSDSRGAEIPEEEEEDPANRNTHLPNNSVDPSVVSGGKDPHLGSQDLNAEVSNMSLNNGSNTGPHGISSLPSGIIDYATIEWSYKDPSGQIQGPFNAELMQKWCDDGYFSGDLPVKRTHLDSQWRTVEQLTKQHGGTKIFLTPPLASFPPGLPAQRTEPLQPLNFPQDQQSFSGPLQPAPIRNLRSSTLESYSNPSDSPSSSFGGRLSNESPDPNAFGGRGTYFADNRIPSFSGIPDPSMAYNKRIVFGDPSFEHSHSSQSSPFANIPNRVPSNDGFGYNRTYTPGQNGWNNTPTTAPAFDGTISRNSLDHSGFSSNFANGPGSLNNFGNLGVSHDNAFHDNTSFQSPDFNQYINGASPAHLYPTATTFPDSQHPQHAIPTPNLYEQHGAIPQSNPPVTQLTNQNPIPPRPGPFDADRPTSSNTIIIQPAVSASPWERVSEPPRQAPQADDSAWPTLSQSATDDNWKDTSVPDSLTFSNVGQHNEQQQRLATTETSSAPVEASEEPHTPSLSEPPVVDAPKAAPPPKLKSKASAAPAQLSAPKAASPQMAPEPTPVSSTKVAWVKDDESKAKPLGASISLREIQEAEAKKAEARKAAERERERAARAAIPTAEVKETPSFTASWGLPTSQAGAVPRVNGAVKEPTATSPTPAAPVWTTAVKAPAAKKTMKEIQEEEEKRKKTAVKETTAAAARRAYADTTQKVVVPAAQTGGGVWTTVGPSGKQTTPVVTTRPTIASATSTPNVVPSTRPNGTPTVRPVSVSPTVTAPSRSEEPVSPSHDFLKWLNNSLKGLNSSVNVEEIMSMLLSFPLEPDPSTVELISELIYANSTILDGRRFASEFIAKRKADAASRPKVAGAAGKAAVKPVSIADVVKAVPKPPQSEWGFKVVNKKKKGGRT